MSQEYRVIVRDVYKKYNESVKVLNGLNMNIKKGTMYGLLGPSGCGKTTLMKCILGVSNFDSGSIQLSVKSWRDIGYMPQGTSLHGELEIRELFVFYGTLFGIYGDELDARVNELADLLELPPLKRLISVCSGGQQRRISMAVTLLHDPDFLLLDEPTVGLDPLLSHKIWVYLRNLCLTQRKTIMVTTHYMEEARSLHMIGLMRGGVLLAEKSPSALLNDMNCSTLDDVFLVLSQKQETQQDTVQPMALLTSSNVSGKNEPKLQNETFFSVDHVKAQIYKNYKWTLRNIPVTLFIIFLPVSCSFLTGIIFKDVKTDLKIGYYSEELFNASCKINRTVLEKGCSPSAPYSCDFIDILQYEHPTERFDTLDEGLKALRSGEVFIMLRFPYNFTKSVVRRLSFTAPLRNDNRTEFEDDIVDVWTDNTVYTVIFHAKIDIYTTLQKLMELKCQECGINTALARTPFGYREPVFGKYSTLCSKIYPLFLNALLFYTTFIYASSSVLMEKNSGVLERIHMNGMTLSELLTANFIVLFIVLNIQNVLCLLAIHAFFMEEYLGSMGLMYVILLLNEFFGALVGLSVISYSSSHTIINYMGVGAILTILLTSGLVWPSEAVHAILRPFVDLIPVNMISHSYSHVMLHGFGITHPLVYSGVLYTIALMVALSGLIYFKIRRNNYNL